MFYQVEGKDKKGQSVVKEIVLDIALGGIITRLLTRGDISNVVVRNAKPEDFRRFQRERLRKDNAG